MRISKTILNLALMMSVVSATAVAAASSSCNMRSGIPRTAASNPEKKQVAARVLKASTSSSLKSHRGKK